MSEFLWTQEDSGQVSRLDSLPTSGRSCETSPLGGSTGDRVTINIGPFFESLRSNSPKPTHPPLGYNFPLSNDTNTHGFTGLTIQHSFNNGLYTRTTTSIENGLEVQERLTVEINMPPIRNDFSPKRDLLNIQSLQYERRRGAINSSFETKPEVLRRVHCDRVLLSS